MARANEAKFEPINSPQALLEFIKDGQGKGYFPQKIVQFLGEPRIMQTVYRLQDVDFDFAEIATWQNGADYSRGAKIFMAAQDKNETIKPISENAAFILGAAMMRLNFRPRI